MMRSRSAGAALAVALELIILSERAASAQCAMCRRAFESPEGQQLVAAFRSGIVFLLAAPFLSFAAVAWLAVRRQRQRATAFSDPDSAPMSEGKAPRIVRSERLESLDRAETRQ
jgi:hypothetical protein